MLSLLRVMDSSILAILSGAKPSNMPVQQATKFVGHQPKNREGAGPQPSGLGVRRCRLSRASFAALNMSPCGTFAKSPDSFRNSA
jgi:hypothetical protein